MNVNDLLFALLLAQTAGFVIGITYSFFFQWVKWD